MDIEESTMAAAAAATATASSSPCGACKFLRRKCAPECIFAPYFPPDQPLKFANAHKIFGASNIAKILNELHPQHRAAAVNSLAYEAEARIKDPVYGCVGAISYLKRHIDLLEHELCVARSELARYMGIGLMSEQQAGQRSAGPGPSPPPPPPPNLLLVGGGSGSGSGSLQIPGSSSSVCDHMLSGDGALILAANNNNSCLGLRSSSGSSGSSSLADQHNLSGARPDAFWLHANENQQHGAANSMYEAEFIGNLEAMQLARAAAGHHFLRPTHHVATRVMAHEEGPSMDIHPHNHHNHHHHHQLLLHGRSAAASSINEGGASNVSSLCSP